MKLRCAHSYGWLRLEKGTSFKTFLCNFFYLNAKASKWLNNLMKILDYTSYTTKFKELFSNKQIKNSQTEAINKIEDELKVEKEEINNKGDAISKIKNLNEELIRDIHQLKQGRNSRGNWKKG